MKRAWMALFVLMAGACLAAVSACSGESDDMRPATGPGSERRTIDAAVSVRPGSSQVIYTARGRHGPIGRFIGTCPSRGSPRTAYEPTPQAAAAIAAIDGRGVSRAATVVAGQRLTGGSRASGLERWLVRMGRKSEDVMLEGWLLVVQERGSPDCTFGLYGSVVVLPR